MSPLGMAALKELLLEILDVGEDRDFERPEDQRPLRRALCYLLDTNVISGLRKGERADPHVMARFAGLADEGRMNVPDPRRRRRVLAATACVLGLTLVTRNVVDVGGNGVNYSIRPRARRTGRLVPRRPRFHSGPSPGPRAGADRGGVFLQAGWTTGMGRMFHELDEPAGGEPEVEAPTSPAPPAISVGTQAGSRQPAASGRR
jgi:hypothetical protein